MGKTRTSGQKIPNYETWGEQKSVIGPGDIKRRKKYGAYCYKPEYAKLAFDLLANSDDAKTKSHVCALLHCARSTLYRWMRQNPDFDRAIKMGLAEGAAKWRERIAQHAYEPTANVNNGLIKLLSANVYGIKDEPTVVINNTNKVSSSPEEQMKKRGIPIPDMDIGDVDDV